MKKHLLLIGLTFGLFFTSTQAQDCTNGRYLIPAFTVEKIADVEYGSNFGQDGTTVENLKLDIYLPENDVDTERPVILLAHGGSFIGGNKSDLETQCTFLASLGYVTVSMQYRLINNLFDPVLIADIGLGFKKEVVRAVHDMRAAIRFLRKSFEDEGNPYGIDPDIIIVGGYSAGAILANHVAYLDDENKIPTELVDYFNDQGGLEGNTGNPGYNSTPQMVLSMCGAILDTNWIETGSQPFFGMHNTDDPTVPNLEGQPDIGIQIPVTLQGDSLMYVRALDVNISTFYKSYVGSGHCDFPLESVELIVNFVHEQVCEGSLSLSSYEKDLDFTIYPNPANELFYVKIPQNTSEWDVYVMNMVGEVIHTDKINAQEDKVTLRVSSIDAGVYIVKLLSKNGKEVHKKIVIQ